MLRRLAYWLVEKDLRELPPRSKFGLTDSGEFFLTMPPDSHWRGKSLLKIMDEFLHLPSQQVERAKRSKDGKNARR